jgi:DNA-binding LacI/PurR family transcriptional regulator
LYLRIYTNLKNRIEGGEWGTGAMLPSETALREFYNISRGTVRQVLAELEKEGLVRREQGRGTFATFTPRSDQPSAPFSRMISFIVPYVRDSYVSSMLIGLEREARASGYAVLFNHVENNIVKQDEVIRTTIQQRAAGIALYPVNSSDMSPVLPELVARKYPLVLVDRYIRGMQVDYVTSDNFSGGLIAVQHLLSLGHRRIAFLKWTEMSTAIEHRRCGYRQALVEADLPLDPDLEWEVTGYPNIDLPSIETLLLRPDPPTAIFAANDQLALSVEQAARDLGIAIPQDLALVGFDDLDISAHVDIPLTTLAQPAVEIGRAAWKVLFNKITRSQAGIERLVLPVRLIVRRSCGAMVLSRSER